MERAERDNRQRALHDVTNDQSNTEVVDQLMQLINTGQAFDVMGAGRRRRPGKTTGRVLYKDFILRRVFFSFFFLFFQSSFSTSLFILFVGKLFLVYFTFFFCLSFWNYIYIFYL